MAVIYLDRPVQKGDPLGSVYDPTKTQDFTNNNLIPFSVYDPTKTQDFTNNNSIPFLANSVGTNTQTNQISNIGGEFDFFNNLNFGTDFTKQGLGGYGTFSGEYLDPTVASPISTSPINTQNLSGIQTAAPIDMIPAPITPFINQGNDNDGGITTIDNSNLMDEVALTGVEEAKNDPTTQNLIGLGLIDKAKDYVSNNYGYMIMNFVFPGSGFALKGYNTLQDNKELARIEAATIKDPQGGNNNTVDMQTYGIPTVGQTGFNIHNDQYDKIKKAEIKQENDNVAAEAAATAARAAARQQSYADSYRGHQGGNGGGGGDTESQTNSQAGRGGFADYARGGRIRYGNGGIVTL